MNIERLRLIPGNIVASLENKQIPFFNYIITFLAIVILREYVECYSQVQNGIDSPYPLWTITYQNAIAYLMLVFPLSIITHFASKEPLESVLRVMIPCMLLLLMTPLLDLLLTSGEGVDISYLQPYIGVDVAGNYFSFWGKYAGVSTGMRIEIMVMLTTLFIYLRQKNCSVMRSLIAVWAAYSWIFIFGCTPIIFAAVLDVLDHTQSHLLTPYGITKGYLLILFAMSFLIGYLLNKRIFTALMKDVRFLRISYYELSLLLGVSIALSRQYASLPIFIDRYPEVMVNVALLMMSLFFACLFSLMINNIYDVKIDKISNPSRPLVAGSVSEQTYAAIAYFALGLAFVYALVVETRAILIMGLIMSTYYIYSATPLRLKRVPVVSKLVISVNSAALLVLGYVTVQMKTLGFPVAILWTYFIGVTLAANCIDLKDVAGDKAEGVVTLPILLGNRLAKLIIGAAGFCMGLSYYFILNDKWALPGLALFGAIFFYLVNKPHYQDKKVLLLCNAGLLGLCLFLLTKSWLGIDLGFS